MGDPNRTDVKEKYFGTDRLKDPSTSDVILKVSSVFNGKQAGPGNVYFLCFLKRGKTTYSTAFVIHRKGMPIDVENAIKQKIKINFVQQVIDKLNKESQLPKIKTIR